MKMDQSLRSHSDNLLALLSIRDSILKLKHKNLPVNREVFVFPLKYTKVSLNEWMSAETIDKWV